MTRRESVDYSRTRAARRSRAEKAARLAAAAVAEGVSVCELRASHPDASQVKASVLRAAAVQRASGETWAEVSALLLQRLLGAPDVQACSSCGSPVLRGVGQRSPVVLLEPLPHRGGIVRVRGHPPLVLALSPSEREAAAAAGSDLWRLHTSTCPSSVAVRQRLPRSRRCPICNTALAWWVKDPAYLAHPGCEPVDNSARPLGRNPRP